MKIKRSELKQIIKEELQDEARLQELYIPFIGGKLPAKEADIRRKQLDAIVDAIMELTFQEKERFVKQMDSRLGSQPWDDTFTNKARRLLVRGQLDADDIQNVASQYSYTLSKLKSSRHSKKDADAFLSNVDLFTGIVSKAVKGVPLQLEKEKQQLAAKRAKEAQRKIDAEKEAEEKRRYDAETRANRERQARWKKQDDERAMAKLPKPRKYYSDDDITLPGVKEHKTKITKSQLKQIIKEELETALDEGIMDTLKSKIPTDWGGTKTNPELDKEVAFIYKSHIEGGGGYSPQAFLWGYLMPDQASVELFIERMARKKSGLTPANETPEKRKEYVKAYNDVKKALHAKFKENSKSAFFQKLRQLAQSRELDLGVRSKNWKNWNGKINPLDDWEGYGPKDIGYPKTDYVPQNKE